MLRSQFQGQAPIRKRRLRRAPPPFVALEYAPWAREYSRRGDTGLVIVYQPAGAYVEAMPPLKTADELLLDDAEHDFPPLSGDGLPLLE